MLTTNEHSFAAAADTAYINGIVLTMDESDSIAQAVAVTDGLIVAVGDNESIRTHVGLNTRIVDLDGKTLLPGFIDAHSHFLIAGRNQTIAVDLNAPPIGDIENIPELITRVSKRAKTTPSAVWDMTTPCLLKIDIPRDRIWTLFLRSTPFSCSTSHYTSLWPTRAP
jgi:predicted amidohydrolase YtcJ